jgi:hypothetical protein
MTEPRSGERAAAPAVSGRSRRASAGPDRAAVALFSLAAFLVVLALLGTQLRHTRSTHAPRALVVRRVYRTTVVERVLPAGAGGSAGGASVSQSVSGSGAEPPLPALPVTRTS